MNAERYIHVVGLSEEQIQKLQQLANQSGLSRPGYVRACLQLVLDYGYIPDLNNERGCTGKWVKPPGKRQWYMTHAYDVRVICRKEFAEDVSRQAKQVGMKRQGYTYQVVAWALEHGIIYQHGEPVWTN